MLLALGQQDVRQEAVGAHVARAGGDDVTSPKRCDLQRQGHIDPGGSAALRHRHAIGHAEADLIEVLAPNRSPQHDEPGAVLEGEVGVRIARRESSRGRRVHKVEARLIALDRHDEALDAGVGSLELERDELMLA
jgi:hypothetical protein